VCNSFILACMTWIMIMYIIAKKMKYVIKVCPVIAVRNRNKSLVVKLNAKIAFIN